MHTSFVCNAQKYSNVSKIRMSITNGVRICLLSTTVIGTEVKKRIMLIELKPLEESTYLIKLKL